MATAPIPSFNLLVPDPYTTSAPQKVTKEDVLESFGGSNLTRQTGTWERYLNGNGDHGGAANLDISSVYQKATQPESSWDVSGWGIPSSVLQYPSNTYISRTSIVDTFCLTEKELQGLWCQNFRYQFGDYRGTGVFFLLEHVLCVCYAKFGGPAGLNAYALSKSRSKSKSKAKAKANKNRLQDIARGIALMMELKMRASSPQDPNPTETSVRDRGNKTPSGSNTASSKMNRQASQQTPTRQGTRKQSSRMDVVESPGFEKPSSHATPKKRVAQSLMDVIDLTGLHGVGDSSSKVTLGKQPHVTPTNLKNIQSSVDVIDLTGLDGGSSSKGSSEGHTTAKKRKRSSLPGSPLKGNNEALNQAMAVIELTDSELDGEMPQTPKKRQKRSSLPGSIIKGNNKDVIELTDSESVASA